MEWVDNPPVEEIRDRIINRYVGNPVGATSPGPLVSRFPGKGILALKGQESGPACLLFNGPSLNDVDLFQVQFPLVGMNRTFLGFPGYNGPQPAYLCGADMFWYNDPGFTSHPRLINGSTDPRDIGYRVPRSYRGNPFSFDLHQNGFVPPVPGTTGYLALQAAVYFGFTTLYCVGLDLGGPHFDGTCASRQMKMIDQRLFGMRKAMEDNGISVFVVGDKGYCQALPRVPISRLYGES